MPNALGESGSGAPGSAGSSGESSTPAAVSASLRLRAIGTLKLYVRGKRLTPSDAEMRRGISAISGCSRNTAGLIREEITVRFCQTQDAPAVLGLWSQARSGRASTADRIEDVERLIADSPAALLVAERDAEIVGALIAAWDGWRGNMYRLAVRDAHRRKGIAIALTRAGEEYLRDRGARRVTALVAFGDEVAGSFWDSAGYPLDREIGRRVRNL